MNEELYEKIEAFLNGEMDQEARLQFEKQLNANTALQEQVALYKDLQETLTASFANKTKEEALSATLTALGAEQNRPGAKVVPMRGRRTWMAAAAIILLAVVSIFIINNNPDRTPQQLYASFAVYPQLSGTRGNNDSLFSAAVSLYNNKNYHAAIPLLQRYLATDSTDTETRLAYYASLVETGNYAEAMQGLEKISATENVFTNQAKWYTALCLLKQDKKEDCKAVLLTIPEGTDTYKQAHELLGAL